MNLIPFEIAHTCTPEPSNHPLIRRAVPDGRKVGVVASENAHGLVQASHVKSFWASARHRVRQLRTYPGEQMKAWRVVKLAGDGPQLLDPVLVSAMPGETLSLFGE
jgi:hypothetical protein